MSRLVYQIPRLALALVLCAALGAGTAWARKVRTIHVVRPGDSIAKVADFYAVSQRDLCEMNGLKPNQRLRPGQKLRIPNVLRIAGRRYVVRPGDTLAGIAAKFHVSVAVIARANKVSRNRSLEPGRTLVIPKGDPTGRTVALHGRTPRPILFLRVRTGERERLQLYDRKGRVNKRAVARLSYLARDKIGGKVKRLNYRLIAILQRLAWEFEGKPIEIISGYRANSSGNESQHMFGRAMDLRIPGVAPARIYRFCRSLPFSGCGLYPNAGFVHVDAREKKAWWVDRSP